LGAFALGLVAQRDAFRDVGVHRRVTLAVVRRRPVSIDGGLAKTRSGFLSRLFGRGAERAVTPEWLDELEEALLRSDVSVSLVDSVMLQVRDVVADHKADTVPTVLAA